MFRPISSQTVNTKSRKTTLILARIRESQKKKKKKEKKYEKTARHNLSRLQYPQNKSWSWKSRKKATVASKESRTNEARRNIQLMHVRTFISRRRREIEGNRNGERETKRERDFNQTWKTVAPRSPPFGKGLQIFLGVSTLAFCVLFPLSPSFLSFFFIFLFFLAKGTSAGCLPGRQCFGGRSSLSRCYEVKNER